MVTRAKKFRSLIKVKDQKYYRKIYSTNFFNSGWKHCLATEIKRLHFELTCAKLKNDERHRTLQRKVTKVHTEYTAHRRQDEDARRAGAAFTLSWCTTKLLTCFCWLSVTLPVPNLTSVCSCLVCLPGLCTQPGSWSSVSMTTSLACSVIIPLALFELFTECVWADVTAHSPAGLIQVVEVFGSAVAH